MQNKEKNSFLSGLFKAVYQEYFGSQTGKIKPGEARAESVIHDFDVAQVTHVEKIGNHLVDMRLYSNRIARMLKKHCVNQAGDSGYERIYLSDFTTDCAKKAGLNFTIADCIQFTKAELGNTEPKKPKEPKESVFNKGPIYQEEKKSTIPKKAKGKIVFAGENTIQPISGRPYQTFSMSLRTDDGDVIFSGVDLEKKFRAGHFAVGDVVFIEKTIAEFVNEFGGKREVRVRNEYKVTVIKKA